MKEHGISPRVFSHHKNRFSKVRTAEELIRPKGQTMARHKAGLHKDVSAIFNGVWIPQVDNTQQSVGTPTPSGAAHVHPKQQAPNQSSLPKATWLKTPSFAALLKAFKQAHSYVFPSQAKREKRRLSEISKHLLINVQS